MLVAGFPIVGDVPDSLEFAPKLRAARISVGELLAQSRSAQAAARLATTRSGDDELDEEVYAATAKEIEAGLLREPFEARELDERLGLWTPARRFGLRQNNKVRPVDDFSEYGQKAMLQTYFKVDLGGVDEVAALARSLLTAASRRTAGSP